MNDAVTVEDPRLGRVVGDKYRIVRRLGEGGMGQVYEAQHTVIGRRFAIKCLRPEHAHSQELVARFQREAEAAGGLENENIAAALDFGRCEDGTPYLAMEYLEGQDLAHWLACAGPFPVPRAAQLIVQACRGLEVAHSRSIAHRDLKPENLFVCRRNDGSDLVKILDFGIAKLLVEGNFTQTGATLGTPAYMSLEQARGAKEVDHRTDIYALGVILYELLTGQKPHPGDSHSEVLYHLYTQEPEPLAALRPELPPGLCEVVERAMARNANDRYPSVTELAQALGPFAELAVAPGTARPAPLGEASETVATPPSLRAVAVRPGTVRTSPGRSLGKWLGLGLAALGAASVAVGVLWLKRSNEPTGVKPEAAGSAVRGLGPAPLSSAAPPRASGDAYGSATGIRPSESPRVTLGPVRPRAATPPEPAETATLGSRHGPKSRPFDRKNPYAE